MCLVLPRKIIVTLLETLNQLFFCQECPSKFLSLHQSRPRSKSTDRNGGLAGGGELNKLTITDGWQWKAPPWDIERLVV